MAKKSGSISRICTYPNPSNGENYADGWFSRMNDIPQEANPFNGREGFSTEKMDWNSGWRDCDEELNKLST